MNWFFNSIGTFVYLFVLKKVFLYLILTLFIARGTIESIKFLFEINEFVELNIEFDTEENQKEKKETENFFHDFNPLHWVNKPLNINNNFIEKKEIRYENISRAVPTPPPDNTI